MPVNPGIHYQYQQLVRTRQQKSRINQIYLHNAAAYLHQMLRDRIGWHQIFVQEFHANVDQVTGKVHQDFPALQQPVHSELYCFCLKQ